MKSINRKGKTENIRYVTQTNQWEYEF